MAPRRRRPCHSLLLGLLSGAACGVLLAWLVLRPRAACPAAPSPPPPPPLPPPQPRSSPQRELVLVGVMTAQKYLRTRAVAVRDTWGRELAGRVLFFSSWGSRAPPGLPLVALPGVDDSYPPQKKSFLMLKHMWEHYGDRYEWFVRADDDVYVRPDRLERLLRSVDSRKPLFIGQAGRGNQEEFGLLSLEYDENFCMGGPGVILSRETLARVVPHIRRCLRNLYTAHEDVELGRCVRRFAGVPCTWSYEMQTILYHNSSGHAAFTGSLKKKEVHHAITLHPVKHHAQMYRIHNYMKGLKIQELQRQASLLRRQIAARAADLGEARPEPHSQEAILSAEPGLNKFWPRAEEDVLSWDFISRSIFSARNTNPRRRLETPMREGLEDVTREVMDMINLYSKQRGRVIEFREVLYGYHRLDPVHGSDYILDLLLVYKKYRGRKMTVPVRRHIYVQRPFTGVEIRETVDGAGVERLPASRFWEDEGDTTQRTVGASRDVFESGLLRIGESLPSFLGAGGLGHPPRDAVHNKLINFILPLSGRADAFQRFVRVFEEVCLQQNERVSLIVILYPSDTEPTSFNQSANIVRHLQRQYPQHRVVLVQAYETFARAKALEVGSSQVTDDKEDLLFFIDVDMVFTSGVLDTVRLNTVKGKRAYFPIVYSEFDPAMVYDGNEHSTSRDHFSIDENTGYWRQFGFGIASIYRSDFRMVGGFDTSIHGWGKEDVDLYEKVVSAKNNLTVFRAVDPSLVHVFHQVDCDPHLVEEQLRMCLGSRYDTFGSTQTLARYIYNHDEILKFARKRRQGS
ncbi:chondroitin sulfate synthase 1 [Bacillus rossius redtenbacheri]|uniref:chondroitin sulfate synthase 1 n=1 Tax=Bacillus rossius redtenbacheri TaxID=93214 RepID=UPI002FDECD1B